MISKKYVACFVVNPSGEFVPAELSTAILEPSKVLAVIDESSKRIYLWLGKGSSLNNRMGAKRTVKAIPTFGLRVKGVEFPLGRDCKIIEIDETAVQSDSSTRSYLSELETLLRKPFAKQSDGVWYVKDMPPAGKGETKTEAAILESRMQFEMSHLERETTGKSKKEKLKDKKG